MARATALHGGCTRAEAEVTEPVATRSFCRDVIHWQGRLKITSSPRSSQGPPTHK